MGPLVILAYSGGLDTSAIVPWLNGPLLELHYFPKLGGEFFFYERGVQEYSQVHAAPVADLMRLEIESKVDRTYLWVVHHLEAPSRLVVRDAPWPKAESRAALTGDGWFYDPATKLLYVRARAARNIDLVVNIYF